MKKKIAVLSCGWDYDFLKDFISGIESAAKDKNTDVYVFNAYNFIESSGLPNTTGFSVYNLVKYEDYDGIIVLSDFINNNRILEKERIKIVKSGKPAVSINRRMDGMVNVAIYNYSGFYEIMDHLIKVHKLTDFSYLGGKESNIYYAGRYKAYRTALTDNKIKADFEKVYEIDESNYYHAYNFARELTSSDKPLPEVFVCSNDHVALGVLKACEEKGIKVPEQLKIVGYDNIDYARNVNPALTTVQTNANQAGLEAISILLGEKSGNESITVKGNPIFRCSCGCEENKEDAKVVSNLNLLNEISKTQEFNTQLEKIEDIFTEAGDIFTLLTNLEQFFGKSHHFEGDDFCIFLNSDWSSVLINSEEKLPQNLDYGTNVQSIVSIFNNKKNIRELISTKSLIPSRFVSQEQSSVFLVMPIFHHFYVHGYYVSKNNLSMLDNGFGYNWTRTFGNSIELFRKRNMFKIISRQNFKMSTHDALSGMLNRIGLEKLAKPFYEDNKKKELTTILFFVDINSMKTINDKFGHLHGDLAVKTIAAAVLEVVPKNWLSIRYGGDEFLVIGNSKSYNGEDYCTLITQRIAKKTNVMQLPYNLSASIGTISLKPDSKLTLEQAVEEVDKIMYAKKQAFHKAQGDAGHGH